MHDLYELKETLCRELEEYGKKGEITAGSLEMVDKLAHTVKNLGKIIEMYDEDGQDGSYGYYYADGNTGGGSMARGGSYARGGRRGSRRGGANQYGSYDMGGYSRNDDMTSQLHELMDMMPDERLKSKVRNVISRMENR